MDNVQKHNSCMGCIWLTLIKLTGRRRPALSVDNITKFYQNPFSSSGVNTFRRTKRLSLDSCCATDREYGAYTATFVSRMAYNRFHEIEIRGDYWNLSIPNFVKIEQNSGILCAHWKHVRRNEKFLEGKLQRNDKHTVYVYSARDLQASGFR
jgi:hypothetical protein